jgi:hypothetical protein
VAWFLFFSLCYFLKAPKSNQKVLATIKLALYCDPDLHVRPVLQGNIGLKQELSLLRPPPATSFRFLKSRMISSRYAEMERGALSGFICILFLLFTAYCLLLTAHCLWPFGYQTIILILQISSPQPPEKKYV